METPSFDPRHRELPIVAGHLALNFANTVDDPQGPARHDHAATYDDVVRWSVRVGTVTGQDAEWLLRSAARHRREAGTICARAHELRDALNNVFGGVVDRVTDVDRRWTPVAPFVADAFGAASVAPSNLGRIRWVWPMTGDLAVVLHPIAVAASELLVGEALPRVKRCARCPWLFLDGSRNGSRRWCDMNDCGKAEKMERYVRRRAEARRAGHPSE